MQSHYVAGDSGSSVSLSSEDWAAPQAGDAAARHSRPISLNDGYTYTVEPYTGARTWAGRPSDLDDLEPLAVVTRARNV